MNLGRRNFLAGLGALLVAPLAAVRGVSAAVPEAPHSGHKWNFEKNRIHLSSDVAEWKATLRSCHEVNRDLLAGDVVYSSDMRRDFDALIGEMATEPLRSG